MRKSQKKQDTSFIMANTKFISKLNKTIKNKPSIKKCEQFCKNDYQPETTKWLKNLSKKWKIPYVSPTKKHLKYKLDLCKKAFCNEKCIGYSKIDNLEKNIVNGFQKSYGKKKIEMLKKKGALSGCIDENNYNVFHK